MFSEVGREKDVARVGAQITAMRLERETGARCGKRVSVGTLMPQVKKIHLNWPRP